LSDIGHNCGIPHLLPEIIRLDSVEWVFKTKVALGNDLSDVGHDGRIPHSLPEIIVLGGFSKLRWHKTMACQTSAMMVEYHLQCQILQHLTILVGP